VHPRAKVTIDILQEVVYKKSIGTKMTMTSRDPKGAVKQYGRLS